MSPSEPLLHEIRAARPVAPAALRERVRLVAAQEPAPTPLHARLHGWLDLRRFLLVATPATLVVAVVAAGVIGLTRPDERSDFDSAGAGSAAVTSEAATPDQATQNLDSAREAAPPQPGGGDAVAPSPGRLQRFDAQLDLRVDGL